MSPYPDSIKNRDGKITRIAIPSEWGAYPYPIEQSSIGPMTGALPKGKGVVYTSDDENSFRIRKQLLDAHNYVRKLEAPAATYMTKLVWDFHLEAYALQWAQYMCLNPTTKFFQHSPDTSNGIPAWPFRISTGENLYTTSAVRPPADDFSDVIMKWYNEREYYDWNTGNAKASDASQPVGHYKQLVRQQATAVGCAVLSGCKQQGDWRTFVACQYDYGNIGKDPYTPNYDKQPVCQQCPTGYDSCCEEGLCTGKFDLSQTGLSPLVKAKEQTDEWYGCSTWKRKDCDETGAASFVDSMPNDNSNLEFYQCSCGAGLDYVNSLDIVYKGYFWFRNRCYQAQAGGKSDPVSPKDGETIYNMLELPKNVTQKAKNILKQEPEDEEDEAELAFIEKGKKSLVWNISQAISPITRKDRESSFQGSGLTQMKPAQPPSRPADSPKSPQFALPPSSGAHKKSTGAGFELRKAHRLKGTQHEEYII